jgi:hypothetical protein
MVPTPSPRRLRHRVWNGYGGPRLLPRPTSRVLGAAWFYDHARQAQDNVAAGADALIGLDIRAPRSVRSWIASSPTLGGRLGDRKGDERGGCARVLTLQAIAIVAMS